MAIINDIDLGPSNPWPDWQQGQVMGSALIEGTRTIVWPRGATQVRMDVTFLVTAWQAIGGQAAMTFGAARYLIRQLEELAANPDLQPVYIQWTASGAAGAFNRADEHDGWYVIEHIQPNYRRFILGGVVETKLTVVEMAPTTPASLSTWYSGAALSSNYSATSTALIAFPVGSTQQPPTAASRTGGEGAIPITTSPVPNPLPFVRPGTIAALYTGGCRVWDTINTGSNPVPVAGGTYVNANWVEVKGTQHDFAGDCVVTNGLLLLLYQVGQANIPRVYLWDTSLGTATWHLIGDGKYNDNAANTGTLREVNLDKLGLQEVRVRCVASTSAGNYSIFRHKVPAGGYHVYCEAWPLTQGDTSQTNFAWDTSAGIGAYVTGFTDTTSSTTFPSNLATTTVNGYSAAQGSASGSPLFGFFYQNIPTTAQGRLVSTTSFALGDTAGPASGSFKLYGFFAVPSAGVPDPTLVAQRALLAPLFQQFLFDKTVRWARG